MDDLFLNRMLFEWLRDRQKEQAHAEIVSLKEILRWCYEPIDFSKIVSCSFLRSLATSSCGLKKDYPCSGYL
jgi:hypothetical protein